MELLALALLFATIAALLTMAGTRMWCGRIAAPVRAEVNAGDLAVGDPDAAALPPALAGKIGALLPPSPGEADSMRRRLMRAGCWHPGTEKRVYGVKASLVLIAPFVAALFAARLPLEPYEKLLVLEALVALGFLLPNVAVRFCARRRRKRILLSLANALDLMVMCLDAGLAVDKAIVETARGLEFAHPDLAQELALVNLEIRAGKDRQEALRDLGQRTGMRQLREIAMILIQADRIGTSVAGSLRTHADHLRAMSALDLEEKTGKLGVKLAIPIFLCTLPSVIVVMVGPEIVRLSRTVLPMLRGLNFGS